MSVGARRQVVMLVFTSPELATADALVVLLAAPEAVVDALPVVVWSDVADCVELLLATAVPVDGVLVALAVEEVEVLLAAELVSLLATAALALEVSVEAVLVLATPLVEALVEGEVLAVWADELWLFCAEVSLLATVEDVVLELPVELVSLLATPLVEAAVDVLPVLERSVELVPLLATPLVEAVDDEFDAVAAVESDELVDGVALADWLLLWALWSLLAMVDAVPLVEAALVEDGEVAAELEVFELMFVLLLLATFELLEAGVEADAVLLFELKFELLVDGELLLLPDALEFILLF
jgi:hypothetical protein